LGHRLEQSGHTGKAEAVGTPDQEDDADEGNDTEEPPPVTNEEREDQAQELAEESARD